jgi:hypothetical protein
MSGRRRLKKIAICSKVLGARLIQSISQKNLFFKKRNKIVMLFHTCFTGLIYFYLILTKRWLTWI